MAPPRPTLLLCHGTSFCKEIWTPIAQRLQRAPLLQRRPVDIVAFNFPYHGEKRDVSQPATLHLDDPTSPRVRHAAMDWSKWSTAEVQRQVRVLREQQGGDDARKAPLIGIGHSMGAAALWATEATTPGTFDGLVLFEPMVNADHYPNRKKSIDFLVSVTLQRSANWDSYDEARAELLASRNFAKWHPESLRAYVDGALVEVSSDNNVLDPQAKVALALHPHIEASVYSHDTLPLSEPAMARVRCPTTFHYGSRTQLFFPEFKQPLVDKYPHVYKMRAPVDNTSHALVVEDVDTVADRILADLAELPAFQ